VIVIVNVDRLHGIPPVAFLIVGMIAVIGILIHLSGALTDTIRNILIIAAVCSFFLLTYSQQRLIGMEKAKKIAISECRKLQSAAQLDEGDANIVADCALRRRFDNTPLYYEVAVSVDNPKIPTVIFALNPYTGEIEKITKKTHYTSENEPIDIRAGINVPPDALLLALLEKRKIESKEEN